MTSNRKIGLGIMHKTHYYTDEKNAQIVIALLKAHGVRDLVVSPGATNDCFVLSVQDDPDFKLYSAVDERHAGYLACGIAQASGRPVVINCTGATASRNYMSALTEAYYRKLPIIALTCSQHSSHLGQMYPQMTDRIHLPADIVKLSVQCPIPHTKEEEWACELNINRALLEVKRQSGGPVHINLETSYMGSYTAEYLPSVTKITRVVADNEFAWPAIQENAKVVVWIGSHLPFSKEETSALNRFVDSHNAVVLTDVTSNYFDKKTVRGSLVLTQKGVAQNPQFAALKPDLIIHIGEISGDYPTMNWLMGKSSVWRVNADGELRDRLHRLTTVFEMSERTFFAHYAKDGTSSLDFYHAWKNAADSVVAKRPELPFSNLWLAQSLAPHLPETSMLHLGILNPLRCWNMTDVRVKAVFSNVGGFGIDGGISSMLGSAIAKPDVLHFGVFGDLSFFYDLNTLGSREVAKNLRILVVDNGEGGEFSVPGGIADNAYCGDRVHDYIAAKGHYGCKSRNVVKHLVEDLGFVYLSAENKEEFNQKIDVFVDEKSSKPIVFECFTDVADDRAALVTYNEIKPYHDQSFTKEMKSFVKGMMPNRMKNVVKAALGN